MAYEEISFGGEMFTFEKGDVVEGELIEVREDVGRNASKVYKIKTEKGDIQFWGANALDPLMASIETGTKVRITLVDDQFQFPNGRVGRQFKVEVDK